MIFVSSWDDGHPLDRRVADLHASRGLTATFYVPLRNGEGRPVMVNTDMRAICAAGFEIGSHTADHIYLDALTESQAFEQIYAGKQGLTDILGKEVTGFCYPGGRQPAFVKPLLERVGITHARTVENLRTDQSYDRYSVPTTRQFYPHRWQVLLRNAVRYPHELATKMAMIGAAVRFGVGLGTLSDLVARSAGTAKIFHLWGHSWEVDRLGAWQALEKLLDTASAVCESSMGVSELIQNRQKPAAS